MQENGQNELPYMPLRAHASAPTYRLVGWVPQFPVEVLLCLLGLHDSSLKDEVIKLESCQARC
jgi:hypothetical protein